jgi:uncharacterized protein YecT (DUF1311 family)
MEEKKEISDMNVYKVKFLYLWRKTDFKYKAFFVYITFFLGVAHCGNEDFKCATPHYPPSFDCKKATTPLELEICRDPITSLYDAVLGYLYQSIYIFMNDKDKAALKKEQLQWLWGERVSAYKQDINIIKCREFAGYDWNKRLTLEYGNRICHLLKNHRNVLEKYFYAELAKYATEEEILPILRMAFLWNLFIHYYEEDSESSNGERFYDNETRMVKVNDEEWIVALRGQYLLQITNGDGGVFSFWLINSAEKTTRRLFIESKGGDTNENVVRGYIFDVNNDNGIITIGCGGYMENGKLPDKITHYRLNKAKTTIEVVKK